MGCPLAALSAVILFFFFVITVVEHFIYNVPWFVFFVLFCVWLSLNLNLKVVRFHHISGEKNPAIISSDISAGFSKVGHSYLIAAV